MMIFALAFFMALNALCAFASLNGERHATGACALIVAIFDAFALGLQF